MSEPADGQPAADAQIVDASPGAEANATTATPTNEGEEDIDTEAFDRAPGDPDGEGEEGAEGGQPEPTELQEAEAGADDDEEVELSDGRKVKVPKEVALGNMRDADYRQKTQALADARRAFEAERAKQLETLTSLKTEHIAVDLAERQLSDVEKELAGYRAYTQAAWEATLAENPDLYKHHKARFEHLQLMQTIGSDAVTAAKTALKNKETSLAAAAAEAETANLRAAWTEANETLKKDIPGWSTEKFKEIGEFVMKEFGVTTDQLQKSPEPVPWKMANALMNARAEIARLKTAQTQTKAAATTAKAAEVVPAAKPAGGSPTPKGVTDKLSTAEWMARRNKQVERQRA